MSEADQTFQNSFWSPVDNDFSGFDRLSKRLKDGKHMYDEIADFITKRIKIEQNYGKDLINLVKSQKPCSDSGSTKTAWEMIKVEVNKMGDTHIKMADELRENILKPVNDFRDKQRAQRKDTEDRVNKAQKSKVSATDKTNKCEQKYVKLCKDSDKAQEDVKMASGTQQIKEVDKLRAKAKKAKAAVEAADAAYQEAVSTLDVCRRTWEQEMDRCCRLYNNMEVERLEHQRNALWVCSNICSAVTVEVDKRAEMWRQSLETINIEKDIRDFIKQYGTGSAKPDRVVYKSYYEVKSPSKKSSVKLTTPESSEAVSRPKSNLSSPTATSQRSEARKSLPSDGGSTSSLSGSGTSSAAKPKQTDIYKAAYKYEPQGPQELTLSQGDVVRITERPDANWWKGTCNGRVGMVPSAYLKPM
eukprot:m.53838 g.53838  ORF g.53838 m.53838 type:complete len:415 (+) comp15469_c0_seq2:352-1596(+)